MKINNVSLATIYVTFVMFMPTSFYLINIPGFPLISFKRLYVFVWIFFFFVLFVNSTALRKSTIQMPYLGASIVFTILLGLVTVYTHSNNAIGLPNFIAILSETILPVFMVWSAFKEKDALLSAVKYMAYVYSVFALYGIIAYLLDFNPLLDLMSSGGGTRMLVNTYEDERGGIQGRAQSFFYHPIVFGYLSSAILIFLLAVQKGTALFSKLEMFFIGITLILAVLLAASRSPILLLLVASLIYIINLNIVNISKIFGLGALVLIAVIVLIPDSITDKYTLMVSSIFADISEGDSGYGGSSMDQRLMQLGVALIYFEESPIYGHGLAFIRGLIETGSSGGLLGGESFIFKLLVEVGLLGMAAYFFLYQRIYSNFRTFIKQKMNSRVRNIAIAGIALLFGHLAFIFSTGEMDVVFYFLILSTLLLKLISLMQIEDVKHSRFI